MTTLAFDLPAPDFPRTTQRASAASIGSVTPSAIVSLRESVTELLPAQRGSFRARKRAPLR